MTYQKIKEHIRLAFTDDAKLNIKEQNLNEYLADFVLIEKTKSFWWGVLATFALPFLIFGGVALLTLIENIWLRF